MLTSYFASKEFDAGDLSPAMRTVVYAAVRIPPTENSTALPAESRRRDREGA